MLSDKMAISHSNHLFVFLTFVFCLLSSLVRVSYSYDYTDSGLHGKKLAVSKHRNNTQRLPNYNWKPPDKYHGPREESTERETGMEFTKAEDPEQRAADRRIKKMQEIRRQEREKWAEYKRNENGELALDNVEETTRASELTSDESITILIPPKSVELDGSDEDASGFYDDSFQESDKSSQMIPIDSTKKLAQHPPVHLSDRRANSLNSFKLGPKQFMSVNGLANEIFTSNRWGMSVKEPPPEFFQIAYATHQHNNNKEFNAKKEAGKQNAAKSHEKSWKDRPLGFAINSRSGQSIIPYRSKSRHTPKKRRSWRENFDKIPKDDDFELLKHSHHFEGKKHPKHSSFPEDIDEESNCDHKVVKAKNENNEDEKHQDDNGEFIPTDSPIRKNEPDERNDTWKRSTIEELLNYRRMFLPDRWGVSIKSPPAEFLTELSRRMHQKNKGHTKAGEEDAHSTDRLNANVSGEESLDDTRKHPRRGREEARGSGHLTVKTESRPSKVKESSDDRSSASRTQQDLQASSVQQPVTERDRLTGRWGKDVQESVDLSPIPSSTILVREMTALWSNVDLDVSDSTTDASVLSRGRMRFLRSPYK